MKSLKHLKRLHENDVDPLEVLTIGRRLIKTARVTAGELTENDEPIEEAGDELVRLAIRMQEDIVFRKRAINGWMGDSAICLFGGLILGGLSLLVFNDNFWAYTLCGLGAAAALANFGKAHQGVSRNVFEAVEKLQRIKAAAFERDDTFSATGGKNHDANESASNRPRDRQLPLHALGKAFSDVGRQRGIKEWESIGADLITKAKKDPLAGAVAHVGEARGSRPPHTLTEGHSTPPARGQVE